MKKFISIIFLLLFTVFSIFADSGYVLNIESSKVNKDPILYRITEDDYNNKQYEILSFNDQLSENDLLQTNRYTSATIVFGGLSINIKPLSRIIIKYAYLREKELKANYELLKGKIHVSFNSSLYDNREVIFSIPKNGSEIVVTGTEFDLNSSGNVKVNKGNVLVRSSDKNRPNRPPKERYLGPGDFGSLNSEIINRNKPPYNGAKK